jgi:hypothetical protein
MTALASARSVIIVRCDGERHPVLVPAVPTVRVSVRSIGADVDLRELQAALEDARMGVRFAIVGPERTVYAARAEIRRAGGLDSEIAIRVTERDARVVLCAHCRERTPLDGPTGSLVVCAGCGLRLVANEHFSRAHAAYLGHKADAETDR